MTKNYILIFWEFIDNLINFLEFTNIDYSNWPSKKLSFAMNSEKS